MFGQLSLSSVAGAIRKFKNITDLFQWEVIFGPPCTITSETRDLYLTRGSFQSPKMPIFLYLSTASIPLYRIGFKKFQFSIIKKVKIERFLFVIKRYFNNNELAFIFSYLIIYLA